MSTKSRDTIVGGQLIGAKIRAEGARERRQGGDPEGRPCGGRTVVDPHGRLRRARAAVPNDRSMSQRCLGWLQVSCHRCKTEASIPLDCFRRPKDTPIWKLEASLKCRSCRKGRYAPPAHMISLTEKRQTTPYVWVHPDEER
jgi:hypothetical protein